jgi:hypothetical protein
MNGNGQPLINATGAGGFNSDPNSIPGVSALQTAIGYTAWTATAICILAVIGLGLFLVFSHEAAHQGRTSSRVGYTMGGCIVVGAAAAIAGNSLGFSMFTSTPQAIPGLGAVQGVINGAAWAAGALCVIGIVLAGLGLLKAHNSGGKVEHLIIALLGCAVVGSASALTGVFI